MNLVRLHRWLLFSCSQIQPQLFQHCAISSIAQQLLYESFCFVSLRNLMGKYRESAIKPCSTQEGSNERDDCSMVLLWWCAEEWLFCKRERMELNTGIGKRLSLRYRCWGINLKNKRIILQAVMIRFLIGLMSRRWSYSTATSLSLVHI